MKECVKEREMPENLEIFAEYPSFGVRDKKTGNVIVPPKYELIFFHEKYIRAGSLITASFYKYDGTLIVDDSGLYCLHYDDDLFVFKKTAGELASVGKDYIFIVYNNKGKKIMEEMGWSIRVTETNIIITEFAEIDTDCICSGIIRKDHVYTHQGELLNIIDRSR